MRKLALLMAVSLLAGCPDSSGGGGGGGGAPTGPTCLLAGDSCFVASGVTFTPTDLTNLQTGCQTGLGGTFTASGTCSTAGTVTGYCQLPNTTSSGVTIPGATMRGYYYAATWDAATSGGACAGEGGTWVGASSGACGNGTIDVGEWCDGANLDGASCIGIGYTGGTLACAANCAGFVTTGCTGPGPVCGDNVAEGIESCDGSDLNGQTCLARGFGGGTLSCAGDCMGFVTTGCTATACGDGTVSGAEVCDGVNLNGRSCATQGFLGGTLSCSAGCLSVDTSACTGSFTPTNASESEANDTTGTADGPYTTDHLISASIGTVGDLDYFAVQNTAGSAVTVQFQTFVGGVGSCTLGDTVIDVYNSGGARAGGDDDAGFNRCSLVSLSIPAGTTYYVKVTEYANDGTIPAYQLQINFP
jgi:hypothetical protein